MKDGNICIVDTCIIVFCNIFCIIIECTELDEHLLCLCTITYVCMWEKIFNALKFLGVNISHKKITDCFYTATN